MSPLKEIVDGIHVQVAKIEDDLKVDTQYYISTLSYDMLTWCRISYESGCNLCTRLYMI